MVQQLRLEAAGLDKDGGPRKRLTVAWSIQKVLIYFQLDPRNTDSSALEGLAILIPTLAEFLVLSFCFNRCTHRLQSHAMLGDIMGT